jgi:mono/diheme cytochrome c family protein
VRGGNLFLSRACVVCHTVRGTSANATVGADPTQMGSYRNRGQHAARRVKQISQHGSRTRISQARRGDAELKNP